MHRSSQNLILERFRAKRDVHDQLIQFVHQRQGQFLEKWMREDMTRWTMVTDDRKIHRKVAQALRDGRAKCHKK